MGNGPHCPLDMDKLDGEASEFCWGEGMEPPSVRGRPPSEGGIYRGTTPDCDPIIGVSHR